MVRHERRVVRVRLQHAAAVVSGAALAILLALLTSQQAWTWQHARTVWEQAIDVTPLSPRPYVNLAGVFMADGNWDDATRQLDVAVEVAKTQAPLERAWAEDVIYANYAVIALEQGQWETFLALTHDAPAGSKRAEACARVSWCPQ